MKKVLMLCIILSGFVTSIAFGDIRVLGEKLRLSVVTQEASSTRPRCIEMTIVNDHSKKWIIIWVEQVFENIYDIKRRPDGSQYGQAILLGTANVYSRDFHSLMIKQCNRLAMEDEVIWREQANTIANLFSEYIVNDIRERRK